MAKSEKKILFELRLGLFYQSILLFFFVFSKTHSDLQRNEKPDMTARSFRWFFFHGFSCSDFPILFSLDSLEIRVVHQYIAGTGRGNLENAPDMARNGNERNGERKLWHHQTRDNVRLNYYLLIYRAMFSVRLGSVISACPLQTKPAHSSSMCVRVLFCGCLLHFFFFFFSLFRSYGTPYVTHPFSLGTHHSHCDMVNRMCVVDAQMLTYSNNYYGFVWVVRRLICFRWTTAQQWVSATACCTVCNGRPSPEPRIFVFAKLHTMWCAVQTYKYVRVGARAPDWRMFHVNALTPAIPAQTVSNQKRLLWNSSSGFLFSAHKMSSNFVFLLWQLSIKLIDSVMLSSTTTPNRHSEHERTVTAHALNASISTANITTFFLNRPSLSMAFRPRKCTACHFQ